MFFGKPQDVTHGLLPLTADMSEKDRGDKMIVHFCPNKGMHVRHETCAEQLQLALQTLETVVTIHDCIDRDETKHG